MTAEALDVHGRIRRAASVTTDKRVAYAAERFYEVLDAVLKGAALAAAEDALVRLVEQAAHETRDKPDEAESVPFDPLWATRPPRGR